MTDTSRHREAVDLECRKIHDAITGGKISAEDGQRWQLMLRALVARAEAAEARADIDQSAYEELLRAKEAAEAEAYKANMLLSAMKKYLKVEPSNPPVTGVEKKDLADKGAG